MNSREGWYLIILSFFLLSSCQAPHKKESWPDEVFTEGKKVFFKTIRSEIENHPRRIELKAAELQKISKIEETHLRLYGILMNYCYRKDEPIFSALLENGSIDSRSEFRKRYLELARFSAHLFVECFFLTSERGQHFRDLLPDFKGKDAVDLVLMSTGYFAKIDLPKKKESISLSPEFERQWGLDAAKFRQAHRITKGKGVRVAVMDSGIDATHPVFRDISWGRHFNFVGRDGFPWSAASPPMVDWGWHGTVVTSIVAKYAPEAEITVYRYIDADTQNNSPYPTIVTSLMGAAIYKAVHDGNDVINISAGTNVDIDYLREACQYAYDNNVIVVAGNPYYIGWYLGEDQNYPGQYETTISVTGIDRLGEGKYGYWEIAGPDAATTVGAPNAPFVAYPTYVTEKDEYAPGISCATPIVTSLVGLIVSVYPRMGTEGPGEYFEAVKNLLVKNADSEVLGFEGFSPECGYGMIDAERTVGAALRLQAARLAGAGSEQGRAK